MSPLALLGLAIVLGLRHAADPDHVAAVAAITTRTRRVLPAMWLGTVWGLGHSLTLFAVGGSIILFNLAVPARVGLSLEFAVGLTLVVVGLLNLNPQRSSVSDSSAGPRALPVPAGRAFSVGLIHGLAGSASVALLVLATVRDPRWACSTSGSSGSELSPAWHSSRPASQPRSRSHRADSRASLGPPDWSRERSR